MSQPKIFISYSHDSPEHKARILALSDQLRQGGIDCGMDQYEESPEEGWPLWCERQVEQSTFVLVACTQTYLRRFQREEAPRKGLGGTWEGNIITHELYNAQGKNTKFIPVTFFPEELAFIPPLLQSVTAYQLYKDYEKLYRRLTGQPFISKPALGIVMPKAARKPLPPQPSLEHKQDFEPSWQVRYDALQVWTASNLDVRDSVITMTNTNATDSLCVNAYIFSAFGEMIACCSCLVPPNSLRSFSSRRDLISNTLIPGAPPRSIVIKLVASSPITGTCNPSSVNPATVAPGMRAWGKTYGSADTPFSSAELSGAELKTLTTTAGFIQVNGGGFGICRSCRAGAIEAGP
jgi:SEFIR domain